MEAVDKGSSGKGEFFTVNLNQIDAMVKLGAGAEEVMSFVNHRLPIERKAEA